MKIIYYGHGSFLIKTASALMMVDPAMSVFSSMTQEEIEAIPCDLILLTHGHIDHVKDVEVMAAKNEASIVSGYEVASWYEGKGYKAVPMNHGGWWSYAGGRIKYVSAIHSSSLPDGSYGGNPGGFVIEDESATIYISGDTALTMDMKLIPLTCKKLDAAILCIGDHFTMGVTDAVLASEFIECDRIIGMHYDTFAPIEIDHEKARAAFKEKNKTLHLLDIGASMEI